MSKKIIAVAVLMLTIVVVLAACKKDDYEVSYTVPGENGEIIEVYKDKDGNEFVTNASGEKIPVTTDENGFYDDLTSLITQTTKTDKDNTTTSNSTTTTTKADKDNTTTTTKPSDSTESTNKKPVIITDDAPVKEDSISWQEIKDAAKKTNKS